MAWPSPWPTGASAVASVRVRPQTGKLFFDFRYRGERCREQTALDDTPGNRKKMRQILQRIEAEITLGTFDYARYFPESPRAKQFASGRESSGPVPLFKDFAETWFAEKRIEWRPTQIEGIRLTLDKYLIPRFGKDRVDIITKAEVLDFRLWLSKLEGKTGGQLSPSRINHIMTPLRMCLWEASDRYGFRWACEGIKALKVPRTEVEPFSLEEVKLIIERVRPDFRAYYTVRFFTGMRTSEIDGLKWKHVDFERREILIREALVRGRLGDVKTDGSRREIAMSTVVEQALREQHKATGHLPFVFCTRNGTPLGHNNVTQRVWYPLLRNLGLKPRRPYQTRHTAATLWLASGESPEWIARQMGHTTTEMLFTVYSRYVPNMVRNDGSAFERLLRSNLGAPAELLGVSPEVEEEEEVSE